MGSDVWVKKRKRSLFGQVDSLVLDIDGVILDVTASFRVAISKTVQHYLTKVLDFQDDEVAVSSEETQLFKLAGGFNNDWELTYGAVLFYLTQSAVLGSKSLETIRSEGESLPQFTREVSRKGGGLTGLRKVVLSKLDLSAVQPVLALWDQDLIKQIFQEYYGGTDYCPRLYGFSPQLIKGKGLVSKEKVLIDKEKVALFAPRVAVLTGRTEEEARLALKQAGLDRLISEELVLFNRGELTKPNPQLLEVLANRLDTSYGVYVGDSLDDLSTVKNFRRGAREVEFLSAIVARNKSELKFYAEESADLLGLKANSVLEGLLELKGENYERKD